MEISFVKEKRSEVESEIRKGYDAKGREVKINEDDAKDAAGRYYTDANGNRINATGENDYKAQRRQKLVDDLKATPRAGDLDSSGELSDQGRKKVEDKLGQEFNEILRKAAQRIGRERYRELEHEAKEKVGVGNRLIARSTSGSYDPRNLANIKADRREGLGLRFGTALIAAVAMGIRLGFKEVPSADPKRDFLTEMRDILGNAMKIKLEVKSGGSHDESHKTSGGGHH